MPATAMTPAATAAPSARAGEIALEVGVAEAPRVAGQEDRREVGARGHEEDADQEGDGIHPARDRISLRVADRNAARGDSAGHGAHEERRQYRRERERAGGQAPAPLPCGHPLECEARATEHDPESREAERDEQGRHDRREGLGKAGPQHHEHEDQPDVIGLPDRADRPGDQGPRTVAALAAAATSVQNPAPKSAPPNTA